MATVITFKKSSTQNDTPSVSDLSLGELAVNTYHGRFYTEKNDGSAAIVEVGSVPASLTINDAITFPTADGSANQILKTDGSGALSWSDSSGSTDANLKSYTYSITSTTTGITGNDDDGQALDYVVGKELVFLNGVLLQDGSVDYATPSTSTITLQANAESGDVVVVRTPDNDTKTICGNSALTTTNADQTVLSIPYASAKGVKISLSATHASAGTHSCEVLLSTDGSNAYISQYADVITNSSLFTLSTTISGSNILLRATPANTSTTFNYCYNRLPGAADATVAFTATTSDQLLAKHSVSYKGIKYILNATHASAGNHSCEVLLSTDGGNSYYSQYGDVFTNAALFTLNTDISNSEQRLLVTPANTNTTVTYIATKIGDS